jgi:hypothetical protein
MDRHWQDRDFGHLEGNIVTRLTVGPRRPLPELVDGGISLIEAQRSPDIAVDHRQVPEVPDHFDRRSKDKRIQRLLSGTSQAWVCARQPRYAPHAAYPQARKQESGASKRCAAG